MALALLLASMVTARADDVYKWVDAQGVTHYGASPPAGSGARRLDLPAPPAPSSAAPAGARPAPAATPTPPLPRATASGVGDALRVQDCAYARLQVEALERGGPVYRLDEHGQRVFLPDDRRDAEIRLWRERVNTQCAGVQSDDATRRLRARAAADARCATEQQRLQELQAPGGRVPDSDIAAQRARVQAVCGTR
jgi:hypothetical protein